MCGSGSLRRLPKKQPIEGLPLSYRRAPVAGNLRALGRGRRGLLGPARRADGEGLVGTYRRLETRRVILGGISR